MPARRALGEPQPVERPRLHAAGARRRSMSAALAARISGVRSTSRSAAASRAAFFSAVDADASRRDACPGPAAELHDAHRSSDRSDIGRSVNLDRSVEFWDCAAVRGWRTRGAARPGVRTTVALPLAQPSASVRSSDPTAVPRSSPAVRGPPNEGPPPVGRRRGSCDEWRRCRIRSVTDGTRPRKSALGETPS